MDETNTLTRAGKSKDASNLAQGNHETKAARQYLAAILALLPAFTYGIQIGWVSPMIPILQSKSSPSGIPLTDGQVSWMTSAFSIGAIFGVIITSYITDKFGRKISVIALSLPQALCWVLTLAYVHPTSLIIARILAGLAGGGVYIASPLYIREICEDRLRGILGSFFILIVNVGILTVYVLGGYLGYYINLYIYIFFPIVHMLVFLSMPESPAFLMARKKKKEAIKAISWLRNLETDDDIVNGEANSIQRQFQEKNNVTKVSFANIVKTKSSFRAVIICIALQTLQTFGGSFAVLSYTSIIFKSTSDTLAPNLQTVLVGVTQLIGSFIASSLIERSGRKILLISTCTLSSAAMLTLGIWFYLMEQNKFVPGWIPVVAACAVIFSNGAGMAPVPSVIMTEIFSYQLRVTLSGVTMMYSWITSFIVLKSFHPVAEAMGTYTVFFIFSAVCLFGTLFTVFFVPETKGKSLNDIQMQLVYGRKYRTKLLEQSHKLVENTCHS